MTFALTVPGTDIPLVEHEGLLSADGHEFGVAAEGIWDLVRPERRSTLDSFAADYAAVRSAEHRELEPGEVQTLPVVDDGHPLAAYWNERAKSHLRFKRAIAAAPLGSVVDIGAGCAWLAADLARDGWQAAAVDVTVEGGDGLASARYHNAQVLLARAEMQALPFATNSVDMAVFNASLHYAADIESALQEAARVLRPRGILIVLDSPIFADPQSGQAMVLEFAAYSEQTLGVPAAAHEGPGFLTHADLHGFDFRRTGPTQGVRHWVNRWRGARRLGRETADRPMLLATIGDGS